MLTYNGIICLSPQNNSSVSATMKDTEGNTTAISISSNARNVIFIDTAKIVLSDDDTPPAKTDYVIGNEVSGLTLVSFNYPNRDESSKTYRYGEFPNVLTVSAIYSNETNSDITVKEIAFYGYWAGISWGPNKYFMIAREVFDTPIVIEPNQTKSFTINIK